MLTPRPVAPAVPVLSLPLSSAIGSIHHVDCNECADLLEARGRCRARGDETEVRRIDTDLDAHCAERHVQGRSPAWAPGLDEFAVDLSNDASVAGQVVGWDGAEVILRVPGEDQLRHTSTFRQANVLEELSVKNSLLNRRGGGLPW
ncbi:hypothetical protein CTZ27_01725 [Streptomyces griseocarneus]|nr:hypothetical protein CTZ27_01725 [Streptomyces griseocarneus]